MRQGIDRLLRGQFEYEHRSLTISIERLDIPLKEGEVREGSFEVSVSDGGPLMGEASATEPRLRVLTPSFSGSVSEIAWSFDGRGLSEGDAVEGELRIVSDGGEALLPYRAVVEKRRPVSSMGEVVNLFHFANLARTDWAEALSLFYSPEFTELFNAVDHADETLYRGLSAVEGSAQGMEEFLISVHKKNPVVYHCDPPQLQIDDPYAQDRHELRITRDGWGYTDINIEVEGAFLKTDTLTLTQADLTGNFCILRVFIDTDELHPGKNMGALHLKHPYGETVIPVTVRDEREFGEPDAREVLLTYELQLMRLYEDFRCKRIGSRAWLDRVGKLITAMDAAVPGEMPVIRLYTAQYLITAGRGSEAGWILDKIRDSLDDGEIRDERLKAYHLYLTSLLSRDDEVTGQVAEEIGRIYRRDPDDHRVAWLYQYVSETLTEDTRARFRFLMELIQRGCRSPLIYLEAILLLAESPENLVRLTEDELILLRYGARKGLLSPELSAQIVALGRREKAYSRRLVRLLMACFDVTHSDEALEAVVAQLIGGGRTDREAFTWYARAVDRQSRITRLYEYYMMSIAPDEDGVLPGEISRQVLMYFSYQSDLDYDKNAILYRYLHEHRETYPELYNSYKNQIDRFLMEQLDKGRVSDDLAYLYGQLLTRQMVDMENSTGVLAILNTYELKCEDRTLERAYVIYDRLEKEIEIRLNEGRALVPLYGSDYRIFLADERGNRYAEGRRYTLRRLMLPGAIEGYAAPYIRRGRGNLDLFLSELGKGAYTITLDNVDRFRDLAGSSLVRESCRREIRRDLVRFYYDHDFSAQLSDYLAELDLSSLDSEERREVASMLILTGRMRQALELITAGGFYGIEEKLVLRLLDERLQVGELPADEGCLQLAWYAFRGRKYDEQLLKYLVAYLTATSRELYRLYVAAVSFGVDVHSLCVRLMEQFLDSGALSRTERGEVYASFVRDGGGGDIERAYLAQMSYEAYAGGESADELVYDQIARCIGDGGELPDICEIAWLDHNKDRVGEFGKQESAVAAACVRDLLIRERPLPFYNAYMGLIPEKELMLRALGHATIVCRAPGGSEVYVHTRREDDPDGESIVTRLGEVTEGVFMASFMLFGAESLTYYITVESCGGRAEQLVENGVLTCAGPLRHPGRLGMLDGIHEDIAHARREQAEDGLRGYLRCALMADRLFVPVGSVPQGDER